MFRILSVKALKSSSRRIRVRIEDRPPRTVTPKMVEQFGLEEGREISDVDLAALDDAIILQKCLDSAFRFLSRRMHAENELRAKLQRRYSEAVVETTLGELRRLGYLNDERFADEVVEQASSKKQGPWQARAMLQRAGVDETIAEPRVEKAYSPAEGLRLAREAAAAMLPRLRDLDRDKARRRLASALARRGFEEETVRRVVEEELERDEET